MAKKILVLGWYGHGNLGDEAFIDSFKFLWPQAELSFSSAIPSDLHERFDAVWIGGGSFLDQPIPKVETIKLPLAFIGVGLGNYIAPTNRAALARAKIVVVRDQASLQYWPSAEVASDLVFARSELLQLSKRNPDKQILFLANDFFSVNSKSAAWQLLSGMWFIQEAAKVCDVYAKRGYRIKFLPMQTTHDHDDRRNAASIISRMTEKKSADWHLGDVDEASLLEEISKSELVINQRFHGAVFSTILRVPFFFICSHQKMTGLAQDLGVGSYADYYGFTDAEFFSVVDHAFRFDPTQYLEQAKERWKCISVTVAALFCL